MFVDNQVVKQDGNEQCYDKFAIAAVLFSVSYEGSACSLIESQVIKNCDVCNLKYLCRRIDDVIQDFTEKTTVVTHSFTFES